jgi:hypothetical protein
MMMISSPIPPPIPPNIAANGGASTAVCDSAYNSKNNNMLLIFLHVANQNASHLYYNSVFSPLKKKETL